jgi:DNA-binding NtrC family response regulator
MRILLIDDDPDILRSVGDYLKTRGHRLFAAGGGAQGLGILRREEVDIVITDVKMPDVDGFEVLREVQDTSPHTEVIMVTGFGDIDMAVQAMRQGAFDFFTKPIKMVELSASIERTVRFHALRQEKDRAQERLDRLDAEARERYGLSAILGEGAAIQKVRDLIRQVCRTDATTVLICGETGAGKELVARAIHCESARAGGPFVAVDCASIPPTLMESAFYGHEKGAFTDAREARKGHFEQADGGVLFLDEIGDMPLEMQARLLRTLQERSIRRVGGSAEIPVNVRVVSATNRDLPSAIAEGRFREDLYYRLNAFTIQLPPLRERPEDIPALAQSFLRRFAREMQKPVEGFSPEALALLRSHPFPGNCRELGNVIERAVILCQTRRIAPDDLLFSPSPRKPDSASQEGPELSSAPLCVDLSQALAVVPEADLSLSAVEAGAIREALRRCAGNRGEAARILGLSRFALRRRMAHYKIEDPPDT